MANARRWVLLVATVTLVCISGCGMPTPACGPTTCPGCCSADGQCVQLSSESACGRGGAMCRTCVAGEVCSFGSCMATGFGAGGGNAGAGGGATAGGAAGGATAGGAAGGATAGGGAGGGSVFCGPATCAGCCRSDGSCNLGPTNQSCGAQGQLCRDCQALGQQCSQATFSCVGGAGGGAAGGAAGGSAGGSSGGSAGGAAGGSAGGNANDTRLRLFLTSTTFTGAFGGLTGADQRCQTAATAANKGGTWIALLGTSSTSAISRVTGVGPWFQEQSNGTFERTYNNVSNLQTGALALLNTDEQGRTLSSAGVLRFWSGMNADGMTAFDTCSGWTTESTSGAFGVGTALGGFQATSCFNAYRLLCLEQSRLPRPPPPSSVRKRVFLTSTTFTGALGGLTGADQRCQTAATAGNKGGTWIALLGTSSTSAISRVTGVGPWFQEQSNGTFERTYNNVSNLQTGALALLNTDEQGRTLSSAGVLRFWSGMNASGATAFDTCSGWTTESTSGAFGVGTALGGFQATSCFNAYRLLCIEQ